MQWVKPLLMVTPASHESKFMSQLLYSQSLSLLFSFLVILAFKKTKINLRGKKFLKGYPVLKIIIIIMQLLETPTSRTRMCGFKFWFPSWIQVTCALASSRWRLEQAGPCHLCERPRWTPAPGFIRSGVAVGSWSGTNPGLQWPEAKSPVLSLCFFPPSLPLPSPITWNLYKNFSSLGNLRHFSINAHLKGVSGITHIFPNQRVITYIGLI